MATATAMHTNGKVKDKPFQELMAERRKRAEQGLASGAYTVEFTGKEQGAWSWTVHGPHGAYAVTAHRKRDGWRWQCTCQDFRRHAGIPNWKCKHIHMVELAHRKEGRTNGKAPKSNGVNGKAKAAQVTPAPAPKQRSDEDFRNALYYAVEAIEGGRVKRDGPNAWVIRDRGEAVRVQRDGHAWACSVCGVGECRHTVTARVLEVMQTHGFWAPLPATRILEAQRKPEMKPGHAETPSVPEPVTVTGSGGTELIRVLGDIVEQLQELNQNLRAIEKSMEQYLGEVVDATKALSEMVAGIPEPFEGLGSHLENIAVAIEAAARKGC